MRPAFRQLLADLLWALFAAVFFTYKTGYLFGTIDGEELLPVVYRLLDQNLYPGDPFVDAAVRAPPLRAAFIHTLAFFGHFTSVANAALALQGLCLVVNALLLIRITRILFPTAPWAAPLAPILAMVYFGTWTLGGNAYLDNMLLPHSFAAVGGTAGALLFLGRRYLAAGAVLGVAALYQPLLGGQLFGMLCLVELFSGSRGSWQSVLRMASAFTLVASPLIIGYLLHAAPQPSAEEHALFTERYFGYQHGLHYLPSLYPATNWLHFGGLTSVGLLLIFSYKHTARKGLALFAGIGIIAMLLYTALVEGTGWLEVSAVQAFKCSVWIAAAMALVVAGYVGKGLSALLPASPGHPVILILPLAGLLYCGAVITNASGFHGRGLGGDWYRIGSYPRSDLSRLHRWLRDSTAESAVVISSPIDVSLLCEAQRSTPASYKAFLHQPKPFLEWFGRYHRVYNLAYTPGNREAHAQSTLHATIYDGLTSVHFDTVCRYDYRIAHADAQPDSAMNVIRSEGNWHLLGRKSD